MHKGLMTVIYMCIASRVKHKGKKKREALFLLFSGFSVVIMARRKVRIAFIMNNSARKATYNKRKKGLLKKASELSTLCGINACMIMYSPFDSSPEVWPSVLGAQDVLAEFRNLPQLAQSKKMLDQESYLKQRLEKFNEQLMKQRNDNREKEVTHIMFEILNGKWLQNLNLNVKDLDDLLWVIDQKLKNINRKKDAATRVATTGMQQRDGSEVASITKMEPGLIPIPFMSRMVDAQNPNGLSQRMIIVPYVNNGDLSPSFGGFFL